LNSSLQPALTIPGIFFVQGGKALKGFIDVAEVEMVQGPGQEDSMIRRKINRMSMVVLVAVTFTVACQKSYEKAAEPPPETGRMARVAPSARVMEKPPMANRVNYDMLDDEEYNLIEENPFLEVLANPLSTFSIDVDTASYSNVRRNIRQGKLPPVDAVRIEELINYFTYDYPEPVGEHPFSITTEISDCPWNREHKLVRIGLKGRSIPTEDLPPSNLVFLLDVSGSMYSRLPLVKSAMRLLVDQMREEDRIAIVVYAGAAGLVLPSTPGDQKAKILETIDSLESGGSTAGGAGINLAYKVALENRMAEGNNRIILATDGDFNVGPKSQSELHRLIEARRSEGVFLTVLGFGMGNTKDSKMELLADKGNVNYAYIDSMLEARKVLVSEFGGTLLTIAKDVKIQVEFNPARVSSYRLIGYENRMLRNEDFRDDKKDAGEIGSGHTVTALFEIVPAGEDEKQRENLKYTGREVKQAARDSDEIMTVRFRYKEPNGDASKEIVHPVRDEKVAFSAASDDFRFAAAVVEFGLLLRDSQHKGDSDFTDVIENARGGKGDDSNGYRSEFISLVETARSLKR
jgi:Ca-activated chloride channel family protein